MAKPLAPIRALHADGTVCPRHHRHSPGSGRPLTEGCPGRLWWEAHCMACAWSVRSRARSYVDQARRNHVRLHNRETVLPLPEGPALQQLLQADAHHP